MYACNCLLLLERFLRCIQGESANLIYSLVISNYLKVFIYTHTHTTTYVPSLTHNIIIVIVVSFPSSSSTSTHARLYCLTTKAHVIIIIIAFLFFFHLWKICAESPQVFCFCFLHFEIVTLPSWCHDKITTTW